MVAIENIPDREKIAQLIFPKLDIDEFDDNFEYYKRLTEIGVGGFCLFGTNADTVKIRDVVTKLHSFAKIPLLFCADMEHGLNMRFKVGTSMPRAEAVGNTKDPLNARIIAEMIAKEARSCGILWNLAPVVDINSNPDNPIVFLRSFGSNLESVIPMATNYIIGTQTANVLACAKHFPGHGDTNVDSHISLPIINKSISELTELELLPFFAAIKFGVGSIMVGHLIVPSLDESNLPASISYSIITKFLKEKLNYQGLVVTDALDMKSMHSEYDKDELAYLSFKAGADVLLMPENANNSYKYLLDNLDVDDINEIENSFNKIIEYKTKLNLFEEQTYNSYDVELHLQTSLEIATKGLLTVGDSSFLPIKEEESFLYVGVLIGEQELSAQISLNRIISSMTVNDCDTIFINDSFDDADADYISDVARSNDLVVIALIQGPQSYRKREKLSDGLIAKINQIAEKSNSVCMSFGAENLSDGIKTDFYIITPSDNQASFTSACAVITGSNENYNYVNEVSKLNTD